MQSFTLKPVVSGDWEAGPLHFVLEDEIEYNAGQNFSIIRSN